MVEILILMKQKLRRCDIIKKSRRLQTKEVDIVRLDDTYAALLVGVIESSGCK